MKTKYEAYSENELYGLFCSQNVFSTLTEGEKQQALQEVVNRQCMMDGIKEPFEVRLETLEGNTSGVFLDSERVIVLNKELVCNQQYVTHVELENGEFDVQAETVQASNLHSLRAVYHEYRHGWQINGTSYEQRRGFEANMHAASPVAECTARGHQYIDASVDSILYHLQPRELDAFRFSEQKVEAIIKAMPFDQSYVAYQDWSAECGYEKQLINATKYFGVPADELVHSIENTLVNAYYGMNYAVDPKIKAFVEAQMVVTQNYYDGIAVEVLEEFDQAQNIIQSDNVIEDIDLESFDLAQRAVDQEECIENLENSELGQEITQELSTDVYNETEEVEIEIGEGINVDVSAVGIEGTSIDNGVSM